MARSSLLSSIVLILAIFIVIMFAVTDIENTATRKPFSPNAFSSGQTNEKGKPAATHGTSLEDNGRPTTQNVDSGQAQSGQDQAHSTTSVSENSNKANAEIIYSGEGNSIYPVIIKNQQDDLSYNLNFENFKKAGLSNLLIQRKPFNGTIFNDFNVNELSVLEVNQQSILSKVEDTTLQATIIETWEFKAEDELMAKEIYDLMRNKFIGSLGISVNETNQFGQQSFYVNFEEENQNVFLVVKQYNSVYALSYLKGYHDLIKALFKLI